MDCGRVWSDGGGAAVGERRTTSRILNRGRRACGHGGLGPRPGQGHGEKRGGASGSLTCLTGSRHPRSSSPRKGCSGSRERGSPGPGLSGQPWTRHSSSRGILNLSSGADCSARFSVNKDNKKTATVVDMEPPSPKVHDEQKEGRNMMGMGDELRGPHPAKTTPELPGCRTRGRRSTGHPAQPARPPGPPP